MFASLWGFMTAYKVGDKVKFVRGHKYAGQDATIVSAEHIKDNYVVTVRLDSDSSEFIQRIDDIVPPDMYDTWY